MPSKKPLSDLLDKQQAADYISTKDRKISVRKLELLATEGRIGRVYIPGARGKQVRFKREDLNKLKTELASEAITEQPATALMKAEPQAITPAEAEARQRLLVAERQTAIVFAGALDRLSDTISKPRPSVPISEKVSLTMAEAVELSGMSESRIRRLMDAGKVRHDKGGQRGALRISKADLLKAAEQFDS